MYLDKCSPEGKKILIRLDLNSPLLNNYPVDNPRFAEHAKTLSHLLKRKVKIVILAHQGRKGGKDYLPSLEKHAKLLSKHLHHPVNYIDDLFGNKAKEKILAMKDKEVILLKNVRAYDDEFNLTHSRYPGFCKMFDFYINDALSVCHRRQGSIIIPPKYLPSAAGYALEKELSALKNLNIKSKKKTLLLLGGEKFMDYLPILSLLKNKNFSLLASGVLANALLVAKGHDLGYEKLWMKKQGYLEYLPMLKSLLKKHPDQIFLPKDFATGNTKRREILLSDMPSKDKIWDVGHKTVSSFLSKLDNAEIVFMKGPLGFSEKKQFSYATVRILSSLSNLTKKRKIYSLIGGGHLSTTIDKYHIPNNFSHVSLSGGALIQYLSGKPLPGLVALENSRIIF